MEVLMAQSHSRQLTLFSQEQLPWSAFSEELQHAIEEVVSLLLEHETQRASTSKDQQTEATHV
jgi:hypothetical protein